MGNVTNTADSDKPVSIAQQAALNAKLARNGDKLESGLIADAVQIVDAVDNNKRLRIDVGDIASGNERVMTMPNRSFVLNPAWEQIGDVISAPAGTVQVTWGSLSAYRMLRLHWDAYPIGVTAGLILRGSTDNGASVRAGGADYRYQGFSHNNGGWVGVAVADSSICPLVDAGLGDNIASGEVLIQNWNNLGLCNAVARSFYQATTGFRMSELHTIFLFDGRNGLRFSAQSGSFSGKFILEGLRA
jgi:hypothetical protein